MTVSKYIAESMIRSSWIRKMFEEGIALKAKFGNDKVFDFTLGNPDLDPPEEFFDKLKEIVSQKHKGMHGYMPNAGYPDVRKSIAEKVSKEHGVSVPMENIIMTCGAAGALNIVFKTILNPGDEVIVPKPFFVEYGFYIHNHRGVMVLVDTNDDFSLNIENIAKAVTENTKAVLINSPNNPTGKVYPAESLSKLADLLRSVNKRNPVYLISDEPYRDIVFNNIQVSSILGHYNNSIIATSYSKSLSIPGERIGYCAVNDSCHDIKMLMAGLVLSNRILGYVNAPAIMQRVVAALNDVSVDAAHYEKRMKLFAVGLRDAGYSFSEPDGAFYIFCKSPEHDDVAFVQHLVKYNILVVPGTGFGGPGYFRIAYCVPESSIEKSLPLFKKALMEF